MSEKSSCSRVFFSMPGAHVAEHGRDLGPLNEFVECAARIEAVAFEKHFVHLLDEDPHAIHLLIEHRQHEEAQGRRAARLPDRFERQRRTKIAGIGSVLIEVELLDPVILVGEAEPLPAVEDELLRPGADGRSAAPADKDIVVELAVEEDRGASPAATGGRRRILREPLEDRQVARDRRIPDHRAVVLRPVAGTRKERVPRGIALDVLGEDVPADHVARAVRRPRESPPCRRHRLRGRPRLCRHRAWAGRRREACDYPPGSSRGTSA